ncbi:MAG: ubiquinol oxidase subunit II [Sphingomonas sp.]|uniref:ubiquinol oxidase subunit II n=1 Tax=Sphingomonas sp. TaxID=28214 RepID=UPI001ACC85B4|nr:ubiquinol oxidase subunit II [Sphingomonas sp.]MBN8809366.1 ubiquinol oxidase subunit II [Sphingomonas sp.]
MPDRLAATKRRFLGLAAVPVLGLLSACDRAVLNPAGDVAMQQRDIIYFSTAIMLLIIVPVIVLIVLFAWRYRAGNQATYDPDFDHSTSLELVIWSAPLLIIICLGALTWWSTHLLDPFRPLDRIAAGRPADPKAKPLVVQVVSLDWKWLFIYPEQGIATVNELALPVDRQVRFDMTSTNMMNTFYAPAMAGMIYTMPGMRSTLHAVVNRPGVYDGLSGSYSGAGFSDMHFKLYGVGQRDFDAWVARVKGSGKTLDTTAFLALAKPSEKVPPMYFAGVDGTLFDRIYRRCVAPGSSCANGMHGMAAKPEGALFKSGAEKGVGPNVTTPPPHDPQLPHERPLS